MMTRYFFKGGGGEYFFSHPSKINKKKGFFLSFCFPGFNYNNAKPIDIKNSPFHCFGVNCFQTNCELVASFVI